MKRIKRLVAVVLSLAIIMTGIYWSEVPADNVQAATVAEDNAEMLNVKVQVAENDEVNVMRFVSSVDSLNYRKVGFEITKEGGQPKNYDITTVYKRIESLLGEELKYTFSPKVVDTSAEYFITGLWKAEPSVNYTVRAYAVTFDNEWLYGSSRCVALEDGRTTTTHLNMSFEANEGHGLVAGNQIDVTYGASNKETTATVIDADGTTVHVRVQGVKYSDLPSVTKFTFADDNGTEYGSNIFRNLYTEYTGVGEEDTSWYDVYLAEDSTENEFVIATNADMYGFMHLMNGTTTDGTREVFGDKTVYLVSDIDMNDVEEGVTAAAWATGEETAQFKWNTQCVTNDDNTQFQGIFDGQMHTISGVYMNEEDTCVGLFGVTAPASVVRNFYLTESYFSTTYEVEQDTTDSDTEYSDLNLGSVIGFCRGSIDTVYSSAIVQVTQSYGRRIGGIVGNLNSNSNTEVATVNNCWFDGTVYFNYQQGGGVVGYIAKNTVYISNCLYTGTIQSATDGTNIYYAGGIIGTNDGSTAYVNDCVSAGVINAKSSYGSIMGSIRVASSAYHFVNTYGTGTDKALGGKTENATISSICANVEEADLKGISAYENTLLDFEDVWQARTDEVPALKSFGNKITQSTIIDVSNYEGASQTNWYHDGEYSFTYRAGQDTEKVETFTVTKYNIHSLSAFEGFRDYVNAGKTFSTMAVYLNTDIDMNPGWTAAINEETGALVGNEPTNVWTPIGTANDTSFKGEFFGGGHTIRGIYTDGTQQYNGLFGYLNTAGVSDLRITNSYFTAPAIASNTSGSLAGNYMGGTISNIYSDAYIVVDTAATSSLCVVGGILGGVGNNTNKKIIETCWFDGVIIQPNSTLSSNNHRLGGIVGRNIDTKGELIVQNCFNTGIVKNYLNKQVNTGGIVGGVGSSGTAVSTTTIKNCVNLGTVLAPNFAKKTGLGPILGEVNGVASVTINNSHWLNIADLDTTDYNDLSYGYKHSSATVIMTDESENDYNVQHADLATLCKSRAEQTDETKALGFVGHANEGVTPEFLYMNVNGTTTGMNNVVQSDEGAKECIILNDFKDWWLEYHNLTEEVLNVLMIGNSFSMYYVEELYGLAEAAGINMAVYNVYYSGCPVWQYRDSLDAGIEEYDFYVTDSDGRRLVSEEKVGLNYCLDEAEWDAISLQSGRQQSYTDYDKLIELNLEDAKYLYNYIHQKAPSARLLWHHAWEYEVGYDKDIHSESANSTGSTDGQDVPTRANQILRHEVNHNLALAICEDNEALGVEMVPTGDAWDLLREDYYLEVGTDVDSAEEITVDNRGNYKHLCANPDKYPVYKENAIADLGLSEWSGTAEEVWAAVPYAEEYGDMYHDGSIGGGQYLNACVWFEVLTGKSCLNNKYLPTYTFTRGNITKTYKMYYDESTQTEEGVTRTNYDASVLQAYAHQAVEELKTQVELFTNVRSITQGAARVTLEADGIHFYRFTEEQHASVDERCTIAVQDATAGVRLHFKTDSENLTLKVRTSEGVASDHNKTKQFSHDIYVNGELKYELKDEGNEWSELYGDYVGTYELGEGTKEVCIYFPWSVCSVLTGFSLDEGSSLEPVTKDKTVVFYGDSITNGRDVSNPSMHYTAKLAEALNATWINKGVSGDVFRPAFAEMKDDVEPDYIVVAYGTNHFKSGKVDDVTTKIQSFYDNLVKTYPNAMIFAVTPIWRSNADTAQTEFQNLWEISAIIEDAAEQYDNVIAIDGTDFVPHDTAYYSDDLHPNDAGFEQYSSSIIEAINTILASNQ